MRNGKCSIGGEEGNHTCVADVLGDTEEESFANAAFIVQAVNSHDALVAALTGLLDHYTALVNSGDAGNWDPEADDVVIVARAALTQSETGK